MGLHDVILLAAIMVISFVYFYVLSPQAERVEKLGEKLCQMQHELEEKTALRERLKQQYQRLQNNNPQEVERVLREEYGYCREGETMGIFAAQKEQK